MTRPPPPSPGLGAGWSEVEVDKKPVRQEVPADQARLNRATFSRRGDAWLTVKTGGEDGSMPPGGGKTAFDRGGSSSSSSSEVAAADERLLSLML